MPCTTHTDPTAPRASLPFVAALRRISIGLALVTAGTLPSHAAAPEAPLRLGIHNGLVASGSLEVDRMSQTIASQFGKMLARRVEYQVNYGSASIGNSLLQPGHFDLALVRPPNLVAALVRKGWTLVANGNDPEQGVDFIAQPCPGKPGQALVGGPSLLLLKVDNPPQQTCMPPAAIWTAPQVRFLTAARGSLVDLVTRRVIQEHEGDASRVVNASTQSAVPDFMITMHAAIVGAVSPHVAGQWGQKGGVLLYHRPMPPLALLAAPELPADTVAALRAGLRDPSAAAEISRALAIAGWDAPDPKPYQAFMKWLQPNGAPAPH